MDSILNQFISKPTMVICSLFALLSLYFLLIKRSTTKSKLQLPPEPAGAWPVIGHLHQLGGPNLPHITLAAMADKYGPIFTMKIGTYRALVVSSPEVAKEIFTTHDRIWATRPNQAAMKHLGYDSAMFGFAPYGPYWRELRKLVNRELLSNTRLDLLHHVWDSEINTSIKELYDSLATKNNAKGRGTGGAGSTGPVLVEMKRWFADLTLNITVRMVAGKRYFGANKTSSTSTDQCDNEKGDSKAWKCQRELRNFFRLVGLFVVSDALPFLGWLDLGGHEREMKNTARELDVLVQGWLDEHKRKRSLSVAEGGEKINGEQDFMDMMLSTIDDAKLSGYFDADTINKSTCLNLILGGSDTMMVNLIWPLTLLVNYPDELKKVYDELDTHVGRDRQVDESDIKNLVHLKAVIKETMRLYTGRITGLRQSSEDCTVAGYHVPAGTRLIVNTWKISRDPRYWSDPLEFKPERFLTTHADIELTGQNFELIPFGSGRRSCPGASFAIQLLHLALARLVHGFWFERPSDAPIDTSECPGLTNFKATPLEVLATPRLPSKLYVG